MPQEMTFPYIKVRTEKKTNENARIIKFYHDLLRRRIKRFLRETKINRDAKNKNIHTSVRLKYEDIQRMGFACITLWRIDIEFSQRFNSTPLFSKLFCICRIARKTRCRKFRYVCFLHVPGVITISQRIQNHTYRLFCI